MNRKAESGPEPKASTLDLRAIAGGLLTALICVGGGLILALAGRSLLHFSGAATSNIALACSVVGFTLGGFRSGLLCPTAPLSNGAIAAACAYVPLGLFQRLVAGKQLQPITLMFATMLAMSLGMFGGFVSNTANRNRARR